MDLAKHLMVGAAYQARINLLLSQGASIPVSLQRWKPLNRF
ncbi:2-nitropropane dioxygenase [Shewanella putrefaciens]|nr:2-nitropropane dioxygenase [Shewanella putrefaciens]